MSKAINPVEKIFNRYHVVTFFLLVLLVLGAAIIVCYQQYDTATTPDSSAVTSKVPSSFDTKTIDQVKKLHRSSDPIEVQLPSGRINPFE